MIIQWKCFFILYFLRMRFCIRIQSIEITIDQCNKIRTQRMPLLIYCFTDAKKVDDIIRFGHAAPPDRRKSRSFSSSRNRTMGPATN